MPEIARIIIFTALSLLGVFWVFQQLLDLVIYNKDTAATVKIIRVCDHKNDTEFMIRTARNRLIHSGQERNSIILLVCCDSDGEAQEICKHFCEDYGNIKLCSEHMLPQELVHIIMPAK